MTSELGNTACQALLLTYTVHVWYNLVLLTYFCLTGILLSVCLYVFF